MFDRNEKTQEDLYLEELYSIEGQATKLSEPIIQKLAKKIISTMNRDLTTCMKDDYVSNGCKNFFDQYAIEIQTLFIDEILPGLDETIEDWIYIDIDRLTSNDRFILACSGLTAEIENEDWRPEISKRVRAAFHELAEKHYNTVRIQKIVNRATWL